MTRKQQTRPVVIPLGEPVVKILAGVVLAVPILSLIFWILD